jgi:hypothetical protein
MLTRWLAVPVIVAVAALCPTPARAASDEVKLAYAPKIEQKTRYTYRSELVRESTAGDKSTKLPSNFEFTIQLTPKALNPDTFSVELRLLRYTFADESMKGKSFDSDKPDADELAKVIAPDVLPLLDKPMRLIVANDGQIVGIDGVQDLPQTKALPRLRSQLLDQEVIKRAMRPLFSTRAPDNKAAPGSTWSSTDQTSIAPGIAATASNTHTLKAIDKGLATIDITAKVEWPAIPERGGVTVKSIGSTFTATQVWDIAASRLSNYESSQRTTSDLVGPQGPMKQDTTAKITITLQP